MKAAAAIGAAIVTIASGALADDSVDGGAVVATRCDAPACGAELPGAYGGYVRSRLGRATAPFFTEAMSEVESQFTQAISFEIVGHWRLRPDVVVGGRLPMAPSLVKQPAGSYLNKRAFGNPELFIDTRRALPAWRGFALELGTRASLGLPLAGHGPEGSLAANRALEISNAMEGWQLPEHYTPGVLPLTGRARLDALRGPWLLSAIAKVPVLLRISDASLPDEANPRPVAIVPHVSVGAAYWPVRWFGISTRLTAVVQLPAPVEAPGDPFQLSVEPRFEVALLDHIVVAVQYWFPLGGPLSRTLGGGITIGLYR